jgi:hypothetical protein
MKSELEETLALQMRYGSLLGKLSQKRKKARNDVRTQ